MATIFEKLNLKNQTEILVLNAPQSFEPELAAQQGVSIQRQVQAVDHITFSLAFVTKQQDVNDLAAAISPKAQGDAVVWFAYPKGTSKKYKCEFNRDTGWDALKQVGFEAVRQVAVDEDWSALRFRRVEYIKSMTRKF
jgi:hypothetical protein